jgi:hypothetical protein
MVMIVLVKMAKNVHVVMVMTALVVRGFRVRRERGSVVTLLLARLAVMDLHRVTDRGVLLAEMVTLRATHVVRAMPLELPLATTSASRAPLVV